MESFFSSCYNLELSLLSALALSLDIAPNKLTSIHSRGENEFRLLHYPATLAATFAPGSGTTRFPAHTDFGTLTLLFQDSSGGLEVEDQVRTGQGIFHAVTNPPGMEIELILQVGDSLQRLTNDGVKAGLHRVNLPTALTEEQSASNGDQGTKPADVMVQERYSVAYFCKPDREASIGTLQEFITEDSPAKYESLTAIEYNKQRQASTY